MKNFLLISACCALFFVSCHRDNSNPTGNGQLTLIVDSVFQAGSPAIPDSTLFTYDQAGRLAAWSIRSYDGTVYTRRDYMITRDNQNRVTKVTDNYLEGYSGVGPTSTPVTIHEVHYSGASDQASFVYDYPDGNAPSSGDSMAITYTGTNISDIKIYPVLPASAQSHFSETTWTYDNSGRLLSSISQPENSNGSIVFAYAFDDKVNPIKFDVEGLFSDANRMSNGNLLTSQENLVGYGTADQVIFNYTYRNDGRPLRAVSGGTNTGTTTYVYSK